MDRTDECTGLSDAGREQMNRAEIIMPGVIRITNSGPAIECDDDAWLRDWYRQIGLNPDDAEHGAERFTIEEAVRL